MAATNGRGQLLVGKKQIADYLQIGGSLFYEMIKAGMPARALNGRWMAYSENLDEFFKTFTRVDNRGKAIPEETE
jgi:hypothetical protein